MENLVAISPFFIVKDPPTSVAYYTERLGFALAFEGPPDDVYYASVARDGISIMLKAIAPDVLPQPNHTRHVWALGRVHLRAGPRRAVRRVQEPRRDVRQGAVVHRRRVVGIRDRRR